MQFNLFTWLREGVRQSVLLGVADAVEQIGTPDQDSSLNKDLQGLLQSRTDYQALSGKKTAGKKRLGRTLKELDAQKSKK